MAIPHATTTIAVLRPPAADEYAEPYSGAAPGARTPHVAGVRAVIDLPGQGDAGREYRGGGEQTVTELRLICDPCDLRTADHIRDEATDTVYRVEWLLTFPGDFGDTGHTEAGIVNVQGLV
jgi:hypothetical protein